MSNSSPKRVFFSHAHEDHELAQAVCNLLELGAGLEKSRIFCTSTPDKGIGIGQDFKHRILTEIEAASAALVLVTPAYTTSPFCMCELGALWGRRVPLAPLIAPPLTVSQLTVVLEGVQAIEISKRAGLDKFRDFLSETGTAPASTVSTWNQCAREFVKDLPRFYRAASEDRQRGESFLAHLDNFAPRLWNWLKGTRSSDDINLWAIVLDIDKQKQINLTFGTAIGDEVIAATRDVIDGSDSHVIASGRCGDDTFFAIVISTELDIKLLCDALLQKIRDIPAKLSDHHSRFKKKPLSVDLKERLWVTASAGYAPYMKLPPNVYYYRRGGEWLKRAYAGCQKAQRAGGNQCSAGPEQCSEDINWS